MRFDDLTLGECLFQVGTNSYDFAIRATLTISGVHVPVSAHLHAYEKSVDCLLTSVDHHLVKHRTDELNSVIRRFFISRNDDQETLLKNALITSDGFDSIIEEIKEIDKKKRSLSFELLSLRKMKSNVYCAEIKLTSTHNTAMNPGSISYFFSLHNHKITFRKLSQLTSNIDRLLYWGFQEELNEFILHHPKARMRLLFQ